MNHASKNDVQIRPRLLERACGGWLAVSPDDASLRIGVTASTEDDAREQFRCALDRWLETLARDGLKEELCSHG